MHSATPRRVCEMLSRNLLQQECSEIHSGSDAEFLVNFIPESIIYATNFLLFKQVYC